ncbi:MAG: IS1634 family transposase [Thermodesulfobacteriota bacterium]|nr:IS1634 family transposase [Thermodesulfobacteriota bacterium]
MHLNYSTSKYKGNVYKSYSIAESYREGKKVKKRTIWSIGKLTDRQADQIKLILKVAQSEDEVVTRLKDIVVKDSKAYLDIALVNELWNYWQLDQAFDFEISDSPLSTPLMAKILTINRCTDPCSHYSVPKWAKQNALAKVLNIDLIGLNDDKIYYELDKIYQNHFSIENYLFKQTYLKHSGSYQYINYDLTTSYFVGYKCKLSAFGKGKAECRGRRQVLLGVLINDEGYPFKWDVFPGNTAEVKTLKRNINACKTRFKLSGTNVTLVFDRGIISDDNAQMIEDAKMKYISALDRNQIPGCGVDLTPFKQISTDDVSPKPDGFKKYDDELYFHDHGVIGDKRFIVGFNPALFAEDRKNRKEKIRFFETYLKNENKDLKNAQRDRKLKATEGRVLNELKRLKIKKYYEEPTLHPIVVKKRLKNGTVKSVNSFRVQVKKKTDIIVADKLLDGVCVFITNHIQRQGRGFKVNPRKVIHAYRDKTKIEDVFKNVKSFLKIRPFFVNTEKHVKAVYTICILAYFLNKFLANRRKAVGEKDYLNSKELYAPFKDIDFVTLFDQISGETVTKPVELPEETKSILEKIRMPHVSSSQ